MDLFLNGPKVNNIFGQLCRQICCQELSKIAQTGHTARHTQTIQLLQQNNVNSEFTILTIRPRLPPTGKIPCF